MKIPMLGLFSAKIYFVAFVLSWVVVIVAQQVNLSHDFEIRRRAFRDMTSKYPWELCSLVVVYLRSRFDLCGFACQVTSKRAE